MNQQKKKKNLCDTSRKLKLLNKEKTDTWTVPNSSELSSTDVPTKSNDKHFKERASANSCNWLTTVYYTISSLNIMMEKGKKQGTKREEEIKRMSIPLLPSFFSWPNDVKDIWNIWKRCWSLKEQATLRWFVAGIPALAWGRI